MYMKNRVQMFDALSGLWVKYDTNTGAVMQVKHGGKPFARVKRA